MSNTSLVTLSISSADVRALEVRAGKVKVWGTAPLEAGMVRNGRIVKPSAVAAVIDGLFTELKLSRDMVVVTISGTSFTYRLIDMPDVSRSMLQEAMVRTATREIPVSLEELYLSWQHVGSRQGQSKYFLLGTPREPLDSLAQTLNEARIKNYQVGLRSLSLARLANQVDAAVVALEPDLYNIVVVTHGVPAVLHTVVPRSGPEARLEDNLARLADEINKTIKFHNLSYPNSHVEDDLPLLVTGSLAAETAVSQMLPELTGRQVQQIAAPLKTPAEFPVENYGVNLGLALKRLAYRRTSGFVDVNLNVISDLRKPAAAAMTTRTMMLTLALVLVAAAAGFLWYSNQTQAEHTASLRQNLADYSAQLRVLIQAGGENQALQTQIEATESEIEALKELHQTLLGVRGELLENFKLTDRALPAGVSFANINVDQNMITIDGFADQPEYVVAYARALERAGFSSVRIVRLDGIGQSGEGHGFVIRIEP